jgi:L,D-peptidoglycan transpeptidase YkuD (ErfK/YbiS/YcfS/YnhG family)
MLAALAVAAVGTAIYFAVALPGHPPTQGTAGRRLAAFATASTTPPAPPPATTTTTAPPPTTAPAAPPTTTTTTTTTPAGGCPSGVANALAATGSATQLITVESQGYTTSDATLVAWTRQGSCWVLTLGPFTARIGAAGYSDHKHEGDDTTPTGAYSIGATMYGNAPDPGTQYPYQQLVCGDWWDETPGSPTYNTFQYIPCGTTPPFGGDSEALWTETMAYSSLAVIDYNTAPVVPGAGSAVFLHATLGGPTTGCVTIPVTELHQVLDWLDPADSPLIVLGPTSEIDGF